MYKEACLDQKCRHCGDPLPATGGLTIPDHQPDRGAFCCEGCRTVYAMLHEAGLDDFYTIDEEAGQKINEANKDRWAFLDLEEVQGKVLDFTDGHTARLTLDLPTIHCSSCIWLLEHLNRLNPAVLEVQVNFPKKQAAISWHISELPLKDLVVLLDRLGYPADIRPEKKKKAKQPNRSLVIRLGVAGFCFGNIMLLSLPEYLDHNGLLEQHYRSYFLWLNMLLAIPVLLYSAYPFFQSALSGLRHRFINMDVPIALGITVLFARSTYEVLSMTGPGYFDSLAGLVFFLLIGRWYQGKTYDAMSFDREYESYFPVAVTVLKDDEEHTTLIKDLQAGDVLLIRSGELIPADSILLKGEGAIDYAFVTGESDIHQRRSGDRLYAGGRQTGSPIEISLSREVAQGYLTGLWNRRQKTLPYGLGNIASGMGKWFTFFILILSAGTAIYWYQQDASRMWEVVTAVLIVACPCALALAVPFTYGSALRLYGRQGLYLKNADVVEKLASLDTLVFDKTGTITHKGKGAVTPHLDLSHDERAAVAALCRSSTHPLSRQVYDQLVETVDKLPALMNFRETAGQGIEGVAGGYYVRMGSAAFTGNAQAEGTRVYVSLNGRKAGYFSITSEFRPHLFATLGTLARRYRLWLVSGDNEKDRQALEGYFSRLAFNQKPGDKLNHIEGLKAEGKKVMMLGDGLNDAAALSAADIGVSVSDDVYQFSPACDAIMDGSRLDQLPVLLRLSRVSRIVVLAAFGLSLTYNAVGIGFAITGMLTPLVSAILMPLSSVTVVGFCTLGVGLGFKFYAKQ
ncbi:heavy metal translocating P-type ATPase [Roseivirga sp. BDSF3-8]|uniref:heavy metal translocating P-type ATPase n=1 Tax=Roseivirga sp. BDSF3-8 TaxID=3241598 RepID=UPI003531CDBD